MEQTTISEAAEKRASPASVSGSVKKLLADGADAWKVSQKTLIALAAVPFIVALAGIAAALASKEVYKWFTQEDGFAESLQVVFYSLALVLSLVVMRHLWRSGRKRIALLYLGLSGGLFFLIGEELNWGQRIFGWATLESFAAINKQEETNLHNIYGVGATFKWIQMLVGAYGALLPLVVMRSTALARYRETLSLLVPHYTLIPYFALLFIWRAYRNLAEAPEAAYFAIAEYNEVMELILSIGLLLFMIFQLRRIRAGQGATRSIPAADSRRTG